MTFDEHIECDAEVKRLEKRIEKLEAEGTDVMLALEDVVEHWNDDNWPEDTGWSKSDCDKLCKTWEQLL